jgi:hypothetical protein
MKEDFAMRTKRIASVLLAVLMTLSVFGVIGASAAAVKGWDAIKDGFAIDVASKNAQNKEVSWDAFTAAEGVADSDFWTRLNTAKDISYAWVVEYAGANVYGTSGISAIAEKSANKLSLILTPGTSERYGEFVVTLELKVGDVTKKSLKTSVYLVDDADYKDALADANAAVANPDNRYTAAYVNAVSAAIKEAKIYVEVTNPTPERYEKAIALLTAALALEEYQLTGVAFIDGLFSQDNLKTIWKVIDGVNKAVEIYNQYLGEDSWIYKNILSKLDFGQVFSGLIALFGLII